MSNHDIFQILVALHITFGAPGLLLFWVPVLSKKGSKRHRFWGRVFTWLMIITASFALALSVMSLIAPMETHPHLLSHPEFSNPALVRGVFGWMMMYLAIFTITLAWNGWLTIVNKQQRYRNRTWANYILQGATLVAAINCVVQGWLVSYPMMMLIAGLGFSFFGNNIMFLLKADPSPVDYVGEHIKMLVGTGISVYTAFFAFGAVRIAPSLALNPFLWALPLIVGLGIIFYHIHALQKPMRAGKTIGTG